jgi:hypothetical protein
MPMDIEVAQVWEMYSKQENRWVRMIVVKVENDIVTLRPEGLLELSLLHRREMLNSPERFRQPLDAN